MKEDLRNELIKQFPSAVVQTNDEMGNSYYACPTCNRAISARATKCSNCNQVLSWDSIRQIEKETVGSKTATLTFEVPGDFVKGNCRKCPLSFITNLKDENIYECPLKMRNSCELEIH